MKTSDSYQRIWAIVASVPRGHVATYGQIARLAGLGGHARLVGYALHNTPEDSELPWHRVINARGEISLASGSEEHALQIRLLGEEGVEFHVGRIDLERYGWRPVGSELPGGSY